MIHAHRVKLRKLLSREVNGLVIARMDDIQQISQVDVLSDGKTFTAWQKAPNGYIPFEVTIEKSSDAIYVACDEIGRGDL